MAGLSLRQAAVLAGTSKSTIGRAVASGRLSAARTADGGYSIDPSELTRVYPPVSSDPLGQAGDGSASHGAMVPGAAGPGEAALAAEVRCLRELLGHLERDRDAWRGQAERLALSGPAGAARPWWRRLAG